MPTPDYQVQSLTRAVALLRTFTPAEPSLTMGELSRRTGLPRSTVHRLVVNLVQLSLLSRDPLTERYRAQPAPDARRRPSDHGTARPRLRRGQSIGGARSRDRPVRGTGRERSPYAHARA